MTINFKLGDVQLVDSSVDAMSREWIGWRPGLSDQETYEQNRGIWFLGRRAGNERVATFSHNGLVVTVIAVEGTQDIVSVGDARTKQAVVGRVLEAGDPDYDALIGQPVNGHRNPVTYGRDLHEEMTTCACGCLGDVAGNRVFLPGHDQRAIHARIAKQWGTTLGFVNWFDKTYGDQADPASPR